MPDHVRYQPLPIAGDPQRLTPQQRDLIALAGSLGRERFAPRTARHDRDASFPVENYADLREAGLLGICVPREHGGLGADFATWMLVQAELGRYCGSTALSFNMHVACSLWMGQVADSMPMTTGQRADHERHRALHFENIARRGKIYSQPFSEGGAASAGKAPWETVARRVDGGYRVTGRKIFASLAGVADFHGVLYTLDHPGATPEDALYLAIPADAPGVDVTGDWDPLGMRATLSRTLELRDVFVPDSARLLPEGMYFDAAFRWPHMFATLMPTYFGIAQAAYDFTVQYLRAEVPGMPTHVQRRSYPTKQLAVAQMRVQLEQMRSLLLQSIGEARADPDKGAFLRLLSAHYTIMEGSNELCQLAVRTCGGQAMLKCFPLERLYRDSRCGSLMLPLTAELCLDRLGRDCLYEAGEGAETMD
ncbi:MAG TPA: acyl-CoA dehydrogenase family protein [Burkholderiaceae bacterium]|nr:acyl-CoA dehydrogenase family protein [Burkholderiaceae bacterium]